jgi:hypothetical protein
MGMTSAALYRRHAADCIKIARVSSDACGKLSLLDMALAWLALAEQAEKNSESALLFNETPGALP